jgi:hypothetical protein
MCHFPFVTPGAPQPRFPVELSGFRELHAPFLKKKAHAVLQHSLQELATLGAPRNRCLGSFLVVLNDQALKGPK